MIDLRDKDALVPNLVNIGSVLALAASLVLMWLPKEDSPAAIRELQADGKIKIRRANLTKDATIAKTAELHQTVATDTWSGSVQEVNAAILKRVNTLLQNHNLKSGTFRPQRASTVDTLNTLPYALTLDGTYVEVMNFVRDLETPANRLAISSLQVQSADINSDRVNANLTVVAYLDPSPAPAGKAPSDDNSPGTKTDTKPANTKKEASTHA